MTFLLLNGQNVVVVLPIFPRFPFCTREAPMFFLLNPLTFWRRIFLVSGREFDGAETVTDHVELANSPTIKLIILN